LMMRPFCWPLRSRGMKAWLVATAPMKLTSITSLVCTEAAAAAASNYTATARTYVVPGSCGLTVSTAGAQIEF
jgi:type 1 fimbria pilin